MDSERFRAVWTRVSGKAEPQRAPLTLLQERERLQKSYEMLLNTGSAGVRYAAEEGKRVGLRQLPILRTDAFLRGEAPAPAPSVVHGGILSTLGRLCREERAWAERCHGMKGELPYGKLAEEAYRQAELLRRALQSAMR